MFLLVGKEVGLDDTGAPFSVTITIATDEVSERVEIQPSDRPDGITATSPMAMTVEEIPVWRLALGEELFRDHFAARGVPPSGELEHLAMAFFCGERRSGRYKRACMVLVPLA